MADQDHHTHASGEHSQASQNFQATTGEVPQGSADARRHGPGGQQVSDSPQVQNEPTYVAPRVNYNSLPMTATGFGTDYGSGCSTAAPSQGQTPFPDAVYEEVRTQRRHWYVPTEQNSATSVGQPPTLPPNNFGESTQNQTVQTGNPGHSSCSICNMYKPEDQFNQWTSLNLPDPVVCDQCFTTPELSGENYGSLQVLYDLLPDYDFTFHGTSGAPIPEAQSASTFHESTSLPEQQVATDAIHDEPASTLYESTVLPAQHVATAAANNLRKCDKCKRHKSMSDFRTYRGTMTRWCSTCLDKDHERRARKLRNRQAAAAASNDNTTSAELEQPPAAVAESTIMSGPGNLSDLAPAEQLPEPQQAAEPEQSDTKICNRCLERFALAEFQNYLGGESKGCATCREKERIRRARIKAAQEADLAMKYHVPGCARHDPAVAPPPEFNPNDPNVSAHELATGPQDEITSGDADDSRICGRCHVRHPISEYISNITGGVTICCRTCREKVNARRINKRASVLGAGEPSSAAANDESQDINQTQN